MKRRRFILTAAATVAVISVPVIYYSRRHKRHSYPPLIMPRILGEFCDETVIREIGKNYRNRVAAEDSEAHLKDLLLSDKQGKISEANRSEITKLLDKKITDEFRNNYTTIEKGWIISITEARQCALFSITNPN